MRTAGISSKQSLRRKTSSKQHLEAKAEGKQLFNCILSKESQAFITFLKIFVNHNMSRDNSEPDFSIPLTSEPQE